MDKKNVMELVNEQLETATLIEAKAFLIEDKIVNMYRFRKGKTTIKVTITNPKD